MRNYNWLLLLVSVAVHLAVIAGLQINVASSAPVPSSLVLQLQQPAVPPIHPAPEQIPPEIPAPIPVAKLQAKPERSQQKPPPLTPTQPTPVSQPVAIPTAQVTTADTGSFETVESLAALVTMQESAPTPPTALVLPPALPPVPTPPPQTPSPAPTVDIAGLLRSYAGGVKREILSAQSYPAAAERLGHEGTVQVGFTIAVDGSLDSVRVKSSSGFDTIDSAAVAAVQTAAPFQAIPPDTDRENLSMSISLKYYLE